MDIPNLPGKDLIVEHLGLIGDITGTLGMIGIVVAYFAIEIGYFTRSELRYYVVNLVGALLLVVSLLINFNLGSFIIELFWVVISLMGIRRCLRDRRQAALSAAGRAAFPTGATPRLRSPKKSKP